MKKKNTKTLDRPAGGDHRKEIFEPGAWLHPPVPKFPRLISQQLSSRTSGNSPLFLPRRKGPGKIREVPSRNQHPRISTTVPPATPQPQVKERLTSSRREQIRRPRANKPRDLFHWNKHSPHTQAYESKPMGAGTRKEAEFWDPLTEARLRHHPRLASLAVCSSWPSARLGGNSRTAGRPNDCTGTGGGTGGGRGH
jgi:hypothetical protein